MKEFNLAVVVAWLTMFLFSLHIGPEYLGQLEEEHGLHYAVSLTVYKFNEAIWSNCQWCVEPEEPVRVEVSRTAGGEPNYAMQDHYASLTDNRLTQTILRNTFPPLLLFVLALNLAFYAGNGTLGRFSGWVKARATEGIGFAYARARRLRRRKQETDQPPAMQVVELD